MSHAVSGEDAILEVELNPQELRAITRVREPRMRGTEGTARNPRLLSRIVLGLGAAACFALVIAMVVSHRTADVGQSTPVWMARIASALSAIDEAVLAGLPRAANTAPATVKFPNPFDQTEVFEFPPGTSPDEARAKVADLLLQRAQQRAPN